jgi:uncharacterized protein
MYLKYVFRSVVFWLVTLTTLLPAAESEFPFRLKLLDKEYTIYRLEPTFDPASIWKRDSGMLFIARDGNEISLLAESGILTSFLKKEDGWVGLELVGELPFDVYGVLHRLLTPLAEDKIPVLVQSMYLTDYIFLKRENLTKAMSAFEQKGIKVEKAPT